MASPRRAAMSLWPRRVTLWWRTARSCPGLTTPLRPAVTFPTAAAARRRQVNWRHGCGREPLPFRGEHYTVADEVAQRVLVQMLQLAPAAAREVAARRLGVVRPRRNRAVGGDEVSRRGQRDMAARRGDAVAFGGDADDLFERTHNAAA